MAGEPEVFGAKGSVGVVVVPGLHGRDEYVRSVGRDLAAAGFPAAVVDLYGGAQPASYEEAAPLRAKLTDELVLERLEAGRDAVARKLIPHARVGTLGFSLGGGYALFGACRRRFHFAIDFYGKMERPDDLDGLGGPALLLLASDDDPVTPWTFGELLPTAARLKKRVTVELYPGAKHGFHRPGRPAHHAEAAAEAWKRTLSFLVEQRPGRPGSR